MKKMCRFPCMDNPLKRCTDVASFCTQVTVQRCGGFSIRCLLAVLIACLAAMGPSLLFAQANPSPLVQIVAVDTAQFPDVTVALRGTNLPAPLETLPATLTLDGTPLTIDGDQTIQQGIQLALVVDVNGLVTRNASGQSGFEAMTGTLLDLLEAEVFTRNQDWLAAYHLAGDSEPRLLEDWTQEPNQFFNSIVSNRPADVNNTPFTATALQMLMAEMSNGPTTTLLPKGLLLFTTGSGLSNLADAIATAQREAIAIHVVELLDTATATPNDELQQMATQSGGTYTALTAPDRSTAIINALADMHTVRQLQTRVDSATAQDLSTVVILADGSTLTANTEQAFADIAVTPADLAVVAPDTTVSWETLAAEPLLSADARLLPVHAAVTWPDGFTRNLIQLSYTLRGPDDFAQQQIRTEAPFDEVLLPLSDVQNGSYTLELRAIDELGLEAQTAVTMELQDVPAQALRSNAADTVAASSATAATEAPISVEARLAAAPVPQTADAVQPDDTVQLPGTSFAISRTLLLWLLPVLLFLIGYLIYSDQRERRQQGQRPVQGTQRPATTPHEQNPLYNLRGDAGNGGSEKQYALDDDKALATQRFALQEELGAASSAAEMPAHADQQQKAAAPSTQGEQQPQLIPVYHSGDALGERQAVPQWQTASDRGAWSETDAENAEEEITETPTELNDEEATYQIQEVAQPLLGHLMRTTSDPTLPKQLPIYQIAAKAGEVRQIYIGRHRQHNTIVINDKRISREHAVIIQRDGRLYLRDNGSTAGTFLNWKRLEPGEELLLRHNDLVSFGPIAYTFQLGPEDEATVVNVA